MDCLAGRRGSGRALLGRAARIDELRPNAVGRRGSLLSATLMGSGTPPLLVGGPLAPGSISKEDKRVTDEAPCSKPPFSILLYTYLVSHPSHPIEICVVLFKSGVLVFSISITRLMALRKMLLFSTSLLRWTDRSLSLCCPIQLERTFRYCFDGHVKAIF